MNTFDCLIASSGSNFFGGTLNINTIIANGYRRQCFVGDMCKSVQTRKYTILLTIHKSGDLTNYECSLYTQKTYNSFFPERYAVLRESKTDSICQAIKTIQNITKSLHKIRFLIFIRIGKIEHSNVNVGTIKILLRIGS